MKVVEFIRGFEELSAYPNLTRDDFREISQILQVKELPQGIDIFDVMDDPQNFYFIMHGHVSVHVKNPLVTEWDWAHDQYQKLINWKSQVFDKKIESQVVKEFIQTNLNNKIETDVKQIIKYKMKVSQKQSQQSTV